VTVLTSRPSGAVAAAEALVPELARSAGAVVTVRTAAASSTAESTATGMEISRRLLPAAARSRSCMFWWAFVHDAPVQVDQVPGELAELPRAQAQGDRHDEERGQALERDRIS
jgi:hypothetical protein